MNTHIFNIDSRNRDKTQYENDSEFEYILSDNQSGKIKNVVEIKISSIELPNVSHFFNKDAYGNTTFDIYTGSDKVTITVPNGNYNSDEIISTINDLIEDAGIATVEFSVNNNTGKVTITVTATHTFDFSNTTDYRSLGEALGFEDSIFEIEKEDDESFNTKVSENIPNVIGEHYYLLQVNDYGHIKNLDKRYMSKIVLLRPKYEMTFDSRTRFVTKAYKFKQPTNIDKLNIKLVDYLGNDIHLNGVQFSFTIELTVIHNSLLKKYHELSHYSGDLLEIMLHDNMLEFYNRENNNSKQKIGNTLMNNMHSINNNNETTALNKNNLDDLKPFKFNY